MVVWPLPPGGGVRMRSWFRHEQQSIRMALATALHHSFDKVHAEHGAPRSQTIATRVGEEGHEEKYNAPRRQKPPPPQAFFQLHDEEDAERGPVMDLGHRSGSSGTPRSTSAPSCRFSMILCRRWEISCWRSAGFWTLMFLSETTSSSAWWTVICVIRRWRNSLVEVPTILCFLKRYVDIPVPRGRGGSGGGGLRGLLPEQS